MYLFLAVCAVLCLCLWFLLGAKKVSTKETEIPTLKNGYWNYNLCKYNELNQSNKVLFDNWFRKQKLQYEYKRKYKFSNN